MRLIQERALKPVLHWGATVGEGVGDANNSANGISSMGDGFDNTSFGIVRGVDVTDVGDVTLVAPRDPEIRVP